MKAILICAALAATLGAGSALAQIPSGGGYVGPRSYATVVSARQLQAEGRDDQYALLQGRIVSHSGGKHYVFMDDSGQLPVKISTKRFPLGTTIDDKQKVELEVKVDKDFTKTTYEVKRMRVLP